MMTSLPKFRLGPGGEERGEPDQRPLPLVLIPEPVDPVQILDGGMALGVEGEVDDQLPVVARPQRFVRQDSHVGEEHVAGPLAAPPPEGVRDEHLVLLGDAHRLEEHLLELGLAVAGVVVHPGRLDDPLGIHARKLDRDGRIRRLLAHPDLADHARPGAELLGDDLMLPPRNAGTDRPVIECGQAHAGHVLERLDPMHQGGQEQALDEPVVVLEESQPGGDVFAFRLARSRSTSRSI